MNDKMSKSEIAREFQIEESALEGCEVIFAVYAQGDYEGSALVLFEKEGKLYEATGAHCSCYGLEGQWEPEETSLEALKMRDFSHYGFEGSAEQLLISLVFEKEVLDKHE